jgi:16S rRNA (cytosine967-C5)-methyltransferase
LDVTRRVSSARRRAVTALRDVLERGARAAPTVTEISKGLRPEDAGLLRELVLGVLRWRSALDAEIQKSSHAKLQNLAPDLREILEVALYQVRHLDRVPTYAAVDEAVRHARASGGARAGSFVNAVLRRALRVEPSGPAAAASAEELALSFSHPNFLVTRWLKRFGLETTRRLLEADNAPSPLDLMVNPRKTDRATLGAALAAEGIVTAAAPMSPLALTVASGNPVASPLLAAGHFTVQDVGSQALPRLLPAGEALVDIAAAPGGKSFSALAHGLFRRAYCLDRELSRLRLLDANRRRLGMREAAPVAADALALPLEPRKFKRVLFDAPCSGTGTLRKNPEIRYRLTKDAIARLAGAQREALTRAADLLAPGGYLLYSTCSLESEENEEVVRGVLSTVPGLEPAAIEAPEELASCVSENRFQLLPSATNDGFTAHLLRRAPPEL